MITVVTLTKVVVNGWTHLIKTKVPDNCFGILMVTNRGVNKSLKDWEDGSVGKVLA